ncbi:MAG: carboxylesterase/lipase family protein [Pseudonocardia sp.]|uniref:carboxylesterase/lipase family protein n=1 Tax=unclassified Pseudonocardia TaxID=2619320 RepID=UPI00086BEED1|nr:MULTISPECIES: carboxylesterase family protein [unclassified Pseudonocardia]MBN9112330.1 carboxylesterase/lipase family protein [Pseudonocardia sp.]ODU24258.1 MAG: carboxylesterase [Pseudonocardia sp. SCN 72-51]ODV09005.1 MAG: carboxylesterase [Pseudonocardia sp. SCN 73-27]
MTETTTSVGRVRGTREQGVTVFRGIPFAAPPVGDLRFAAPAPPAPWDGVREATAFGPPPPHTGCAADGADWLTLNVWTPDPGRDARLPVMVWVHGGAYTIGSAGLPEYDGARLAAGGVVLVTANYRVGVEGFARVEGAPDNRGLLDQLAMLEWVQDNVAAFGGDPARVTVFGQSAGGGSIAALLTMPRAAGLFRRAVVQSAPGTTFAPELAQDIASAFAAELGLKATVADLADVDPDLLVAASDEVTAAAGAHVDRWGLAARRSILFSPVVDGDVLPVAPWQTRHDVDLLVGHTRDENRLFVVFGEVGPEEIATAEELYAPGPYPAADPMRLYDLVLSDWLFRMPSLHLAERAARAHMYELTWAGTLGACHGLDVPLVFGNLTQGQPASLIGDVAAAQQVSASIRRAWTAFANDGDPGWPTFDTGVVQVFDSEPAVVPYPEEESRRIWRDHVFAPLPLR